MVGTSEVVETVRVLLAAAVVGLVTPSSSTVMECPEGMERPPNSPHVATWPDWLHDPTDVVVETVVSKTAELTIVDRLASDGIVIVILLLAVAARPPVEEVVNDTM